MSKHWQTFQVLALSEEYRCGLFCIVKEFHLRMNAVQWLYICNAAASAVNVFPILCGHKSLLLLSVCFVSEWSGASHLFVSWQVIDSSGQLWNSEKPKKKKTSSLCPLFLNPLLWNIAQEQCAFTSRGVIRDLKDQLVCLSVVLMESVASCQGLCLTRTPG